MKVHRWLKVTRGIGSLDILPVTDSLSLIVVVGGRIKGAYTLLKDHMVVGNARESSSGGYYYSTYTVNKKKHEAFNPTDMTNLTDALIASFEDMS